MKTEKRAWIVFIATYIGAVSISVAQNKVIPCILQLQDYYGIGNVSAGLLSSVFSIVAVVIALPAGVIVARLGERKAGIISLICGAGGALMGFLAHTVTSMLVSRIVEGVGMCLITIMGPSLIARWFPKDRRALPMGIWSTWVTTGQSLVLFLGSGIAGRFGWKTLWLVSCVFMLMGFIGYTVFLRRPAEEISVKEKQEPLQLGRVLKSRPVCCRQHLSQEPLLSG